MPVFPEEKALLERLVDEWYDNIHQFTETADELFNERGSHLDKTAAPWDRHDHPHGYAHEIGKKVGRIKQFLQCDPVPWNKVLDELRDIMNYSRMCGAIIMMLEKRRQDSEQEKRGIPPESPRALPRRVGGREGG